MKTFLKRFWPDSLFGQLLLAMLLGAALLQCVNLMAMCFIQSSVDQEVLNVRYDYNSAIFMAFQNMEPEQRRIFLNGLSRSQAALSQPFQFLIIPSEPNWASDGSNVAVNAETEMTKALSAGSARPLSPVRARILKKDDPATAHPFYKDSNFPLLQMAIQMDDDSWLKITQPTETMNRNAVWAQRIFLLLESILLTCLVFWIIRRATRPLHRLGKAAEKFGRNPEIVKPLPEYGSKEVREASQSFNRMRERICSNLQERNNMLQAMGHDLRTPLARIQLRLERVQPEELRNQLQNNVEEIRSIVTQGLELARSMHVSEEMVPLDVVAFTQSIVDDIKDQGKDVSMEETDELDHEKILVKARPTCLRRCLENLMINAVKYGFKSQVFISREAGGKVAIEVRDEGPGIPDDLLEKVFEPYYRLERSRNRDSGGTGLGLSIARNMVLQNDGSLTLRNSARGGLIACITLPSLS